MKRVIAVLVVVVVSVGSVVGLRAGDAGAAQPPVWVNDYAYGSAGMGFYHDFASGMEWTAERGWHWFSPEPPRAPAPLWVNFLTYGSPGGGFYLDSVSGEVWTAQRGWHVFSPASASARATPTPVNWGSISPPTAKPTATPTRAATGGRSGAICRDGTRSYATGRGACSWHGGVAYWIYD